jgi:hypothetical protein
MPAFRPAAARGPHAPLQFVFGSSPRGAVRRSYAGGRSVLSLKNANTMSCSPTRYLALRRRQEPVVRVLIDPMRNSGFAPCSAFSRC